MITFSQFKNLSQQKTHCLMGKTKEKTSITKYARALIPTSQSNRSQQIFDMPTVFLYLRIQH